LPRKIGRSVVAWWVDFWGQYWEASGTLLTVSLCMEGICKVVLMQDTASLPKLFWPVLSELLSKCLCFTFQVMLASRFCPV
jgi:hypothetical protein